MREDSQQMSPLHSTHVKQSGSSASTYPSQSLSTLSVQFVSVGPEALQPPPQTVASLVQSHEIPLGSEHAVPPGQHHSFAIA